MTETNKHEPFLSFDNSNILICGSSSLDFTPLNTLLNTEDCSRISLLSDSSRILTLLQKKSFDLLLFEIDSPEHDGLELIRNVRRSFSETQLPILIIIEPAQLELRNQALSAGANDYLHKPVDPLEMTLRVKNLLMINAAYKADQNSLDNADSEELVPFDKLDMLIESGLMISGERDRPRLFRHILNQGQRLLNCDGGTMYLVTEQKTLRFAVRTKDDPLPSIEIPLYDSVGKPNEKYAATYVAIHNKSVLIDDVYQETGFDLSGTRSFDAKSQYRTVSMLTVPMTTRNGEAIGVLQYFNALERGTGKIIPFSRDLVRLVEALGAQAAVALDNMQLIDDQKIVIQSMVKVIATAIDAKSHYRGRHCERVPELAMMLAEEACKTTKGPLAKFNFQSDDEWQEFHIGAWLHDCGKVTTPEYVINKATKLDTVYNRIHEIRTRFEVLLRDAEIERLETLRQGGDSSEANARFESRKKELLDDFAFIAECNIAGKEMDPVHNERIKAIAQKTWLRHFDDRLGLSLEERSRTQFEPVTPLPAKEFLLADKLHHLIARGNDQALDSELDIKMDVPEYLYNYGEIYNLSIAHGTLTEEERYKVHEHVIQTIMMLDCMPFPKSLQRVPEYASTHHRTLNGTIYPRQPRLTDLSVPSRIMAIADIFEAITVSNRPYKSPNKLSEALAILYEMKCKQLIDADLFDLFLTSGVYLRYAKKFLKPEQIDQVDISAYISAESQEKEVTVLNLQRPPFQVISGQSVEDVTADIVTAFDALKSAEDKVSAAFNAIVECLAPDRQEPLIIAGRNLAAAIDADTNSHNNAYHNKQHFCEVMLGAYYLSLLKELDKKRTAEVVLAAMIHDFHHDGKLNGPIPFRLERLAVQDASPYLLEAGISQPQQQRLAALILATDIVNGVGVAQACYAHHTSGQPLAQIPQEAPELIELAHDPVAAIQALILCEADVLPSIGLSAEHAMILQNRLSMEWGIQMNSHDKIRFIDYGFRGFIVGKFFSPNVEMLRQSALFYLDTTHYGM